MSEYFICCRASQEPQVYLALLPRKGKRYGKSLWHRSKYKSSGFSACSLAQFILTCSLAQFILTYSLAQFTLTGSLAQFTVTGRFSTPFLWAYISKAIHVAAALQSLVQWSSVVTCVAAFCTHLDDEEQSAPFLLPPHASSCAFDQTSRTLQQLYKQSTSCYMKHSIIIEE